MKSVFNASDVSEIIARVNKLSPDARPLWGKMDAPMMLAHLNVAYEMALENKYKRPAGLKKLMLKWFVKPMVTGDKLYRKSSPTAPEFVIRSDRDFETEKKRLITYLHETQKLGEKHFDGLESHSFGRLNVHEWNNLFYKHLDHHLTQFGV